jgi:hypothetical protein
MRKTLTAILAISVLIAGVDLTRKVWLETEKNPNETFKALSQPPSRTVQNPKSNGYLLLLGFATAPSFDPVQTGYEIWLEVESIPGQGFFDYGREPRLQLRVEGDSLSAVQTWRLPDTPLQVQTQGDLLRPLTAQHAVLLDRYRQWLSMPFFEDWGYGHPGSPRFQDLYVAHRLYVAEGFSLNLASGVDRLLKDLSAWRTVMAKATTLPVKMAAAGMVEDDVLLVSALLRRPDFDDELLPPLDSAIRPLNKAERSLYWPIQNEFTLGVSRYERSWNGNDGLKREESDSNKRWVAALTGLNQDAFQKVEFPPPKSPLARVPAQEQKTLNVYADYSEALMKATEVPNSPLPKLRDFAQASHHAFLDYLVSPIDNIFASGVEPVWKPFTDRLLETDARLRLVALQSRLRRPAHEQSVPSRIAQGGLGFYDPFSGLPMLWNPATGQLYSVGKNGKDDSGDITLDIAVSTSLGMATASNAPVPPAPKVHGRAPKR